MISSKEIEKIVYNLCVQANTILPDCILEKLIKAYETETSEDAKQALGLILTNAKMAQEKKMPLCQDTGQVLVFIKGQDIPSDINKVVNNAVKKAYEENFFRKSVVKNAVFDRTNTKTNTPCVIYTEVSDCATNSENIEIEVLLKGAGCENVSFIEMLSPTASEDEIVDFIVSKIKQAGSKGCPPYFLGVGIGGTIEYAGLLSKKALLLEKNLDEKHEKLSKKIQDGINGLGIGAAGLGGASTALDVKILTDFTHIASMPVAVTVNCHSSRHAKYQVGRAGVNVLPDHIESFTSIHDVGLVSPTYFTNNYIKIHTSEIEKLKSLKERQNILLSGEIYTARDMAHKRLVEMIEKDQALPFDLKDKIIFYAGPCPSCDGCATNSIGPTTASRMDKFAPMLYENGVLATIGKGERSDEVKESIKEYGGIYFTAIGGIACYLSGKVKSSSLVAFEEYGPEGIYKLDVEAFPVRVNFI